MKQYISPDKSKTFREKSKQVQELINTTLYILETFGIPLDSTPGRLERMAMVQKSSMLVILLTNTCIWRKKNLKN